MHTDEDDRCIMCGDDRALDPAHACEWQRVDWWPRILGDNIWLACMMCTTFELGSDYARGVYWDCIFTRWVPGSGELCPRFTLPVTESSQPAPAGPSEPLP